MPPLVLRLQRSRCLAAMLLTVHALAVAAILLCRCPAAWGAVAFALVALSGLREARRHFARFGGRRLVWSTSGEWLLEHPDGRRERFTAWHAPWVFPRLVVLRLSRGGRRTRVFVLCADSLACDDHRRLRVRLRAQPCARLGA
jgi:hypothetical protein